MSICSTIQNSQAIILGVIGIIILLIILGGIFKGNGLGWLIGFIIACIVGYLLISAEVFQIP